jgi:hypothetical protein
VIRKLFHWRHAILFLDRLCSVWMEEVMSRAVQSEAVKIDLKLLVSTRHGDGDTHIGIHALPS